MQNKVFWFNHFKIYYLSRSISGFFQRKKRGRIYVERSAGLTGSLS